jgi:hypothetical protein
MCSVKTEQDSTPRYLLPTHFIPQGKENTSLISWTKSPIGHDSLASMFLSPRSRRAGGGATADGQRRRWQTDSGGATTQAFSLPPPSSLLPLRPRGPTERRQIDLESALRPTLAVPDTSSPALYSSPAASNWYASNLPLTVSRVWQVGNNF